CVEDGTCINLSKMSAKQCGESGHACVACTGDERGCIGRGVCGCTTNSHCAPGLVCDVATNKCKEPCTNDSCATGCCSATGICQPGTESAACGTSGACIDCTGNAAGSACLGTKCGCNSAADCPTGHACDSATKTCTTSCSASSPCNGGCCNGATGQCSAGL